jgi:hypothetical protein
MNREPGDYDFDVAATFAGEDREIVAATVEIVKSAGQLRRAGPYLPQSPGDAAHVVAADGVTTVLHGDTD